MMSIQSQSPQYATPPESFTSPPLTPPPTEEKTTTSVSRIIEEIKNRREGRSLTSIPWANYTLRPEEYQDLLQQVQGDKSLWGFAQNKLRYDYFPSASRLVLRMPTFLHEKFIADIVREIQAQLKSIEGVSAEFAKKISSCGSATIQLQDQDYGRHDPDAQFQHSEAQYPGVIIEVSYSQKRKDLDRLADDYILGSDRNIRVVIGLDIEYKTDKKATLSVWRPNVITNEFGERELVAEQTVRSQVFRDSNGNPNQSRTGGLHLCLRDFATEALAEPEGRLRDPIAISANTLCSFLELAEDKASIIRQKTGIVTPAEGWVRKRRRVATPPEELKHRDERRFRADESRAIEQAIKDDSSYKTVSTSEEEGN